MSDRDVIAAHRLEAHAGWKAGTAGFRAWCTCGWHSDQVLPDSEVRPGYKSLVGESWHDDHVVDMLRQARTITTRAQLDVLPVGTVVRDHEADIMVSGPTGEGDTAWWYDGDPHRANEVDLPALVVWTPADGGDQ